MGNNLDDKFKEEAPLNKRFEAEVKKGYLVHFYRKSGGQYPIDNMTGIMPDDYKVGSESVILLSPVDRTELPPIIFSEWLNYEILNKGEEESQKT